MLWSPEWPTETMKLVIICRDGPVCIARDLATLALNVSLNSDGDICPIPTTGAPTCIPKISERYSLTYHISIHDTEEHHLSKSSCYQHNSLAIANMTCFHTLNFTVLVCKNCRLEQRHKVQLHIQLRILATLDSKVPCIVMSHLKDINDFKWQKDARLLAAKYRNN